MKFTLHRQLSYETFRKVVPRRFSSQIRKSDLANESIALVVFHHDHVVLSSHAQRAIEQATKLSETHRVVVGYDFTCEASDELVRHGFRIYSERNGGWTDAIYKSITKATTSVYTMTPEARHRRYLEDINPRLDKLAREICEASAMEDELLEQLRYQDLLDYYQETIGYGYWHPALTESIADFTSDAATAVRYYQLALDQAQKLEDSTYSILICMAERLFELRQKEQAEACLRDGRTEALHRGDGEYVRRADEVLRESQA